MPQWTNQDTQFNSDNILESAGIKKRNMPHGSILPTSSILTSENLATTPEESSQM
jgi:hypothetical protein